LDLAPEARQKNLGMKKGGVREDSALEGIRP
jgi:hypothetical protein